MSNEAVAKIAQAFYEEGQAEIAANTIVSRATQLWREKEDVIDDITCVVVFLDKRLILKNMRQGEANNRNGNELKAVYKGGSRGSSRTSHLITSLLPN